MGRPNCLGRRKCDVSGTTGPLKGGTGDDMRLFSNRKSVVDLDSVNNIVTNRPQKSRLPMVGGDSAAEVFDKFAGYIKQWLISLPRCENLILGSIVPLLGNLFSFLFPYFHRELK